MTVYTITLRTDGDIRWLRLVLKRLWRVYRLKCVGVEEAADDRSAQKRGGAAHSALFEHFVGGHLHE